MKDTQDLQKTHSEPQDYIQTLTELKQRIRDAQYRALRTVNHELIHLYWDIGKTIVDKQTADPDSWGKSIVDRLSRDLQKEFPTIRGFSSSNIWRMRNFYKIYSKNKKLVPLTREISWTHNYRIFEKCKDDLEREFYIKMTKRFQWPWRVLVSKINNRIYERTLLNQTNFNTTLPKKKSIEAHLSIKDSYSFDFLVMNEQYSERQLENAILHNLPSFLKEMGGVFAFIGNQYKLEINGREAYIDLLLFHPNFATLIQIVFKVGPHAKVTGIDYVATVKFAFHRKLGCLVAIELKATEFKPEYVGKMLFYLTALEEHLKEERENPPIGIILCKTKNRTFVKYTLKKAHAPIGVSKYTTIENLPEDLKHLLPSKEQITILLEGITKCP